MAQIVLTTFNAKYIHPSLGLRSLLANLGELGNGAQLMEFDLSARPVDAAQDILSLHPKIVGIGAYIWNLELASHTAELIKTLAPETCLVLGGPEVSYEPRPPLCSLADYIIAGEGELLFKELCGRLISGEAPHGKILGPGQPDLKLFSLPYSLYGADDLAKRLTYVEASRGCPFQCEFCLSGLQPKVRSFKLESFLEALKGLLERGARHIKFVDRSFNLDLQSALSILALLRRYYEPGMFFHFEAVPGYLPKELLESLKTFPPGTVQLEIGIQTFNPEVAKRIGRAQDNQKIISNLRLLRAQTAVHLHTDLIFGLPGESLESMEQSFNELLALGPQEIQVGILKRLRGARISRHDAEWGMLYNPRPPYDILQNKLIDFSLMQSLKRFARYWDLVANSGNFRESAPHIWAKAPSPFQAFLAFSCWLQREAGVAYGIALARLRRLISRYLIEELKLEAPFVRELERRDAGQGALKAVLSSSGAAKKEPKVNRRQMRHLT